jgi:hypothetical protein
VGVFVNGASLFDWADAQKYNFVWDRVAPVFEKNAMDICAGHAANGVYHHHFHPICLQSALGDTGTAHSPLYGWVNDGFPIYGPYQASGVLATSCWKTRVYTDLALGGCAGGSRTCLLNSDSDLTAETTALAANQYGYDPTQSVSIGGTTITAVSGIFKEDYYFDSTCFAQSGERLNYNNGHDHDNLGFHYHITIDGSNTPVFPYTIGPKYYGTTSGTPAGTPTSTPGSGPGSGSSCFGAFDRVQMEGGELVAISSVKVGDKILSANKGLTSEYEYSPVVYIPHRANHAPASFILLRTSSGRELRVTRDHLLLASKCDSTSTSSLYRADKLETTTHCLVTVDGPDKVLSKESVRGSGVYTLVTLSEYIVVEGVVASPFAVNHLFPSLFYNIHRILYSVSPSLLNTDCIGKIGDALGVMYDVLSV